MEINFGVTYTMATQLRNITVLSIPTTKSKEFGMLLLILIETIESSKSYFTNITIGQV